MAKNRLVLAARRPDISVRPPAHGRVALGITPQGSHKSGRAQLRHPARQINASLRLGRRASSATRWCCVDIVVEFDASAMFPPNGSLTQRPLPSPGSPWCEFPGFVGTMRRSDSRPPYPTDFVVLRPPVTDPCVCLRLSPPPDAGGGAWGFGGVAAPKPLIVDSATAGSPRFLRNPQCVYARIFDPGRNAAPGLTGRRLGSPHCHKESYPRPGHFRGSMPEP